MPIERYPEQQGSCLGVGVPEAPWAVLLGGAALVEDEEV